MKLLFLDTETTGVNASSDQIIEIGGVICQLDLVTFELKEISEFESTVSLRQNMDEKITRITGITTQELSYAAKQIEVQENWANWLEPEMDEIQAIIGHSINFDLDFLKNESWLLPTKVKIVDTLDLSRIFYPELQAINLEFLAEKLNLVDFETKNTYHRSLFDTKACIRLFKNLLLKIKNFPLDKKFIEFLIQNILHLNIQFYTPTNLAQTISQEQGLFSLADHLPLKLDNEGEKKINELTLSGKQKPASNLELLDEIGFLDYQTKLLELLSLKLPSNFLTIIAQIYFINLVKILTPQKYLKFHTKEVNADSLFAELVFSLLGFDIEKKGENLQDEFEINRFEKIIWQINQIAEENLEIGKLIQLIDFYFQIAELQEDFYTKEYLQKIQLFLSGYDFFQLSLQPFLEKGNYTYNYYNLGNEERNLVLKIENMSKEIVLVCNLLSQNKQESNEVLASIKDKIVKLSAEINFNSKEKIVFSKQRNLLHISKPKANFNIIEHLSKLEEEFAKLKINTLLSPKDFASLLNLSGIEDFQADTYFEEINYDFIDRIDLENFYKDKMHLAETLKKPVLILAGQNSTIKDSKKILTENYKPSEYLILGETGSLTKIASKLVRDFVGVAVLKVGSLDFLLSSKERLEFSEIWIINSPYLYFQDFWLQKSKNSGDREGFIMELKRLYLQSNLNYIFLKTSLKPKFLRSY